MVPSLSVIIPTYNRSSYVRGCLTALSESGVPDLEIIVSDDGSTDETREVVAQFPGVQYLWNPNEGTPSTARNRGFEVSKARYVGFLDCDDIWLPGAPAEAVKFLDKYREVDVLFGEAKVGNPEEGFFSWIETAGQKEFWNLPSFEPEAGFRIFEQLPFMRRMSVRNPVFIGACIMRREVFAQYGPFDPALCGAADWELWLRLSAKCTFGFMKLPLGVWTQHQMNMSGDKDGMSREFCSALSSFLKKCNDVLNKDTLAFITEQLRHHLFGYAYKAYQRGSYCEAKLRFRDYVNSSGVWNKGFLYWVLCSLPESLINSIRKLRGSGINPSSAAQVAIPESRAVTKPRELPCNPG